MKYDTAQPYIASYMIIKNKAGEVAFLLRSNTSWMNGHYGLPAGKVEKTENFTDAAIREVREEAGLEITKANLRHILTVHRCEEEGYTNTWVDVYFEVINVDDEPYNAEPDIHGELVWFDPQNLPEKVIPSVKAAFGFMAQGKKFAEWGWEK